MQKIMQTIFIICGEDIFSRCFSIIAHVFVDLYIRLNCWTAILFQFYVNNGKNVQDLRDEKNIYVR